MYIFILILHSFTRWLVVIAGVLAAGRAIWGWAGKKEWTQLDDRLGLVFTIGMDVQVLLGLVLYIFLSPLTQAVFQNFGMAMQDGQLRFFAVEHIFYMIIAVALAHVGRALSRRAGGIAKHQRAAIFFALTMLVVFIATPWARPLLRLGS